MRFGFSLYVLGCPTPIALPFASGGISLFRSTRLVSMVIVPANTEHTLVEVGQRQLGPPLATSDSGDYAVAQQRARIAVLGWLRQLWQL